MMTVVFLVHRYMISECRSSEKPVGFLDPLIIYGTHLNSTLIVDDMVQYAMQALIAQQDKQFIMLPYHQE